ncbi:unnamed protein product [Closterium sp. Yama58-4]|nr:unnamed protein product [Closterium sp. Yama58-4]
MLGILPLPVVGRWRFFSRVSAVTVKNYKARTIHFEDVFLSSWKIAIVNQPHAALRLSVPDASWVQTLAA